MIPSWKMLEAIRYKKGGVAKTTPDARSMVLRPNRSAEQALKAALQNRLDGFPMFFKGPLADLHLEGLHLLVKQLLACLCRILDQMAEFPFHVVVQMGNILLHGFRPIPRPEHASELHHPGNVVAFFLFGRVVDPLVNLPVLPAGSFNTLIDVFSHFRHCFSPF